MVGTDTHGDIDIVLGLVNLSFFESGIFQTCNLLLSLDDGLEDIGIIVRVLALQHTNQTLKAHTGINHVHTEFLKTAVSLAVELHEHKVPDLDDLRVVLVDELATALAGGSTLFWRTRVNVNL